MPQWHVYTHDCIADLFWSQVLMVFTSSQVFARVNTFRSEKVLVILDYSESVINCEKCLEKTRKSIQTSQAYKEWNYMKILTTRRHAGGWCPHLATGLVCLQPQWVSVRGERGGWAGVPGGGAGAQRDAEIQPEVHRVAHLWHTELQKEQIWLGTVKGPVHQLDM